MQRYSGKVELLNQNVRSVKTWSSVLPPGVRYVPIEVEVGDEETDVLYGPGEGHSFENITTKQTWNSKGKVKDGVDNVFRFEVDEPNKKYNVTIPLSLREGATTIAFETSKEFERSKFGFGDLPMHEGPTTTRKMILPSEIQILPSITAMPLNNGALQHGSDLAFDPKENRLVFDSGEVKIDDPSSMLRSDLSDLPFVKENLRVRVYYTLTKLPAN